jgi:hypothetical protein
VAASTAKPTRAKPRSSRVAADWRQAQKARVSSVQEVSRVQHIPCACLF